MREKACLSELVTIRRGTTYKSALLGLPGPVLLGLASIARNGGFRSDNLKTYGGESPESLLVQPGQLFASLKDVTQSADLLGSVARVPNGSVAGRLTQDTVRLDVVSDRVCSDFLYLSLLTPEYRDYCRRHATGTTTLGLQREDFLAYQIWLPPLDEQRRIAGVLGALDDLIEVNRGLMRDLDDLRRTVSASLLDQANNAVPLSGLARFANGKNFTKGATGTGRPVIRTPELRQGPNGGTVWNNVDATSDFIAQAGDVLFVWSGSLMVDRWIHEDGLVNQHIFKVVPQPGIPDWLVFAQIEHQMPWFLGLAADKATTMGHIQRGHLDEVVPMPSQDAIAEASGVIAPMWDAQLQLNLENADLARVRDELLPLLMSGRVRVGEAGVAA